MANGTTRVCAGWCMLLTLTGETGGNRKARLPRTSKETETMTESEFGDIDQRPLAFWSNTAPQFSGAVIKPQGERSWMGGIEIARPTARRRRSLAGLIDSMLAPLDVLGDKS